jgi:hypothetical protein
MKVWSCPERASSAFGWRSGAARLSDPCCRLLRLSRTGTDLAVGCSEAMPQHKHAMQTMQTARQQYSNRVARSRRSLQRQKPSIVNSGRLVMLLKSVENCPASALSTRIESITPVRMFLVHRGRNAWHGTWNLRYLPGYVHASLESAKAHAERERKQGSVFYVVEIATLSATAGSKTLLISELNEDEAFGGVRLNALAELNDLVRLRTLSFDQLLTVMRYGNSVSQQRSENSEVMSLFFDGPSDLVPLTPDSSLRLHESKSVGPTYYLSWSSLESVYTTQALFNVLRVLRQR